ncbi:MAG: YajQ family cyclic di-GMP-binding protein [Zetaproteobacteria bacterium CG_4_9_14_3_um_filter_49_83]|nr:MAG: YajQ family cyclic di-GMP-binding protein [Zetaproteobacteria bacterium CG1_02_49_23]PIQ30884.1 MAG: YajQ family cyclic di-GMP-binding protein [Zetaproteobacteria bacterium CG17_big_fil_post_rev_8_21_14_2_50_50_13]PIV30526.1 MAG: YajQ family cyclic di-GMP-binding protein [Zetaproteobacteria bacterium CG02_land_8_20_14_3_00_50_9]PIY56203.1 MAG: YajQ family cyclic di-GMP-binding protein [Zetaproteobacteria bacterium CG_4_10_14_0_8_um_filter_49_80]PJA34686.1 MAG: YajQ family cyclic di-GMP-
MPSFDVVCEVDMQEMDNAVNQVKKEIATRFDFKGSNASIELEDAAIVVLGDSVNRVNTITEILRAKMVKRSLDSKLLDYADMEDASGNSKRQRISIKQGVSTELAKKVVKYIKQEKMKVQAAIQGEQVRVTGKKRDDLQEAIALIRKMDADRPLHFTNFRD